MTPSPESILAYHQATKHHPGMYAPGPGGLDWSNQPHPFRRYRGALEIPLSREADDQVTYHQALFGLVPPQPLNPGFISRLFFHSLALSARKSFAGSTWALRVNPSSGNLHPTEAYLACGPVEGLTDAPSISHYQPAEHALEVRSAPTPEQWRTICGGREEGIMIGLSSIPWRESWKYGERAYRYCQLDLGHALAALSLAGAGLGWRAELLDNFATRDLDELMGLHVQGPEAERGECMLYLGPPDRASGEDRPARVPIPAMSWQGRPNVLSGAHVRWPLVERAFEAAGKPATETKREMKMEMETGAREGGRDDPVAPRRAGVTAERFRPGTETLREIVRSRRSAQAMDGRTAISRDQFCRMMALTSPRDLAAFPLLPWRPQVHLALFVHRVEGLEQGLYLLVRDRVQEGSLRRRLSSHFLWERPPGVPEDLDLHLLARGDFRETAMRLSCNQPIASDGCFSLAMLAEFRRPLQEWGPWFYPRLFWECGMIGQVLYLEATLAGLRGCGIGCFFDDLAHRMLELEGLEYQDLYHFTVGGAVEDQRLSTLNPYE
ncbi:MAG: hypothetical protein GKC10_05520 [Methanosarcinales archaeon]|nr:hypothetical protein [Methanosarcinales archaeon]